MKTISLSIPFVLLSSGLFACSYPTKARTVRFTELSHPESTRIHNFMRDTAGHEETRSDSLIDEASIHSLSATQACVDLTIRSTLVVDQHPSQWNVKLNGVAAEVSESAAPNTDTWTYTQRTMETTYERTTPRSTTRIEEPVDYEVTAGTTVRRARACAPVNAPTVLSLEVELPVGQGGSDWGQKYQWKLI